MYYKSSKDAIYQLSQALILESMIRREKLESALLHGFSKDVNSETLGVNINITHLENIEDNLDECTIDQRFDLLISNLALSFALDRKLELLKYKLFLKEQCLFIATLLQKIDLYELNSSFILAEQQLSGLVSQIFTPIIRQDEFFNIVNLMGFYGIVSHTESVNIEYNSFAEMAMDMSWLCIKKLDVEFIIAAEKFYKGGLDIKFDLLITSSIGHR